MPGPYSSHGTTVTFASADIGYLTDFDVTSEAGQLYDSTNVTSTVVGTGANARVVREYDCTSIDPPIVVISFWGPSGYTSFQTGTKAVLEFTAPGNYLSGEAILTKWNHSGRKGQWSIGRAEFQLTGNLE
jgi:hypothetical protein